MSRSNLRVIKVGGSLFDLPDLSRRLPRWLAQQPPAVNLLIAGGGALADAIRELARQHGLGEAISHWLCIDAMSIAARVLHALLANSSLFVNIDELRRAALQSRCPVIVFDPNQFLRDDEPTLAGTKLECGWQVTSDSIAARVAEIMNADELVLLKSGMFQGASLIAAAESGYVDAFFPTIATTPRRIRFVNLRDDAFPQCELECSRRMPSK